MGNTPCACQQLGSQRNLSLCLTQQQRLLLKSSLEMLKDELDSLGILVFLRFFEVEPKLKLLFPKIVRVNEDNVLELEMDEDMLSKHSHNVIHSLGAAIENMDDSEFLNTMLTSIGQSHNRNGIRPAMLDKLWPALDHGLHDLLRHIYTKEMAEAWRIVFRYTTHQLKCGMRLAEKVKK